MGMELFELAAKVALDKGDFDKGVQEADDSGKALADNLSKYFEKAKKVIAGLFTVAAVKKAASAVWDLAKTTSAAGDRIDKVSQAIGFSRKKFQEWDYILSQNGASIDDLGLAMKTLDQAIVGNSAEASAALSKLGLSAAHLASLSPEEQFEKVVAALQKMPDGADKSRIALLLFGKNAQSLMPLLNSSAESVEELRQRAHELGLIMSDEDVDASVAFGDALDDLNKVWSAVQMKFGAKILPMLTKGLVNVANLFGKLANAVQDALVSGNWSGVFDVIKNAIHWPSWPDVRDAAIKAWEGIKEGALTLAGLVFGKKEDGTVDWPDWGTVVDAATAAWNLIKDEALNLAGLVFGKKEDGTVNWPDWSTVGSAAIAAWDAIKSWALTLAGLVFGKKEDGTVAWPEWPDVEAAANAVWAEIKKGAENLAGLIFGRKEDGTVAWPEWGDIVDGAVSLWNDIVSFVANIATEGGKLIFGVNEDGEVNWPTFDSLIDGAIELWNNVLSFVANIGTNVGKLIFGVNDDGEVNWPSLDSLIGGAVNLWGDLISFVANIGKEVGKLVFGANEDGEVNWPTLESLIAGAEDLWRNVLSFVANIGTNVGKLIFGVNDQGEVNWPTFDSLITGAKNLWNDIITFVANIGTNVGKLIFGANDSGEVNWPDFNTLAQGAVDLWRSIVLFVANIGTNIAKLIFGANDNGEVNWPDLSTLQQQASALWDKLVGYIADLPGTVSNFGDAIYKAMMGEAAEAIEAGTGWSKIGEAIIDGIFGGLKIGADFIQRLFLGDDISEGWVGVGKKIRGWIDEIFKSVKELPDGDANGIGGQIFSKIWEGIKGAAQGVGDLLLGLLVGDMTDKTTGEAITTWKQYFENIFADFSIGDVISQIEEAWETLWQTIQGKSINIISALIGDNNNPGQVETIASALERIVPALKMLVEFLVAHMALSTLKNFFIALEGLFTGASFSKTQLIITGLSALFVLLYENKDAIMEFLGTVGTWLNDNLLQPIRDVIQAIREFFGLGSEVEKFDFTNGLDFGQFNQDALNDLSEYIKAYNELVELQKKFTENPGNRELHTAVSAAMDEYQKALNKLKQKDPRLYEYYKQFLQTLNFEEFEDLMPELTFSAKLDSGVPSALQGELNGYNLTVPVTAVVNGIDTNGLDGGGGGAGGPLLVGPGNVFFMNAKGDSYVPYDNYPALLHRGEAVLTADQARNWRNGRPDGIDADMLYNAVAEAVAAAIGGIQVNMDGAAVGNIVTNQVSRNMYRKQAGRRFGIG